MDEKIRSIEEYVYARYIDGSHRDPIDEEGAVAELEAYFNQPDHAGDDACVYAGILYFELGYEIPDKQIEYFQRAKFWLERYRALTGEEWDAVDDRLLDLDEFFADQGIEVEEAPMPVQPTVAPVVVQEIEDHGPMMMVPAGTFLFGSEQESINIPAFYIDRFPVTNRQYEAFCRATGYRFPKYWNDKRFNNPDAPVVGVSFADAQKFARWVGKLLPTEEQWEKAGRGVDGRRLPWSENGEASVTDAVACHGRDPAEGTTDPVQAHPTGKSPYGVEDMLGNVWEWTATNYTDGETVHIIKGGCYNDPPDLLNCDLRLEAVPKDKFETIGFRCVKGA